MKRTILGLAAVATAAFAAPHASAAVQYCDATFRPACEQCLPVVDFTDRPLVCVKLDDLVRA
jgi:hypothetical protein